MNEKGTSQIPVYKEKTGNNGEPVRFFDQNRRVDHSHAMDGRRQVFSAAAGCNSAGMVGSVYLCQRDGAHSVIHANTIVSRKTKTVAIPDPGQVIGIRSGVTGEWRLSI